MFSFLPCFPDPLLELQITSWVSFMPLDPCLRVCVCVTQPRSDGFGLKESRHSKLKDVNLSLAFAICSLGPQVSYFLYLSLSFFTHKIGIIVHFTTYKCCWEVQMRNFCGSVKHCKESQKYSLKFRRIVLTSPTLLLYILFEIIDS